MKTAVALRLGVFLVAIGLAQAGGALEALTAPTGHNIPTTYTAEFESHFEYVDSHFQHYGKLLHSPSASHLYFARVTPEGGRVVGGVVTHNGEDHLYYKKENVCAPVSSGNGMFTDDLFKVWRISCQKGHIDCGAREVSIEVGAATYYFKFKADGTPTHTGMKSVTGNYRINIKKFYAGVDKHDLANAPASCDEHETVIAERANLLGGMREFPDRVKRIKEITHSITDTVTDIVLLPAWAVYTTWCICGGCWK